MLHTSLHIFAPVVEFATVNLLGMEQDIADESSLIMAHAQGFGASGICSILLNYDENLLEGYA